MHSDERSEEVKEVIGYIPHWFIRWGIVVIFLILLLILAASWFIHYPDIIQAPFRLLSQNTPKSVNSKIEGKLIRLLVKERELIKEGQILAYLESTARHNEVLTLSLHLDSIYAQLENGRNGELELYAQSLFSQLGEVQVSYQQFVQAHMQYVAFQKKGFYTHKKKFLENELADLAGLEKNLKQQLHIYNEDFKMSLEEFKIQQDLAEQRVIAAAELRREKSKLFAKQLPLKEIESALLQNHGAQIAKRKEILELDKEAGEQLSLFIQSLNTLRSAIEQWKSRYLLTAPVSGRVFFNTFLEDKQALAINRDVFYIVPETGNYIGEIAIPQLNLGKAYVGQHVLIKFAGYPFQEFGIVDGSIIYISEIPSNEGAFLAKVSLPKGLVTNHGKTLAFKTGMTGTAEIITQDARLIEKVFYSLRGAFTR